MLLISYPGALLRVHKLKEQRQKDMPCKGTQLGGGGTSCPLNGMLPIGMMLAFCALSVGCPASSECRSHQCIQAGWWEPSDPPQCDTWAVPGALDDSKVVERALSKGAIAAQEVYGKSS